MMQVTINANRLSRFRSKLAAGTMYTVSGFDAAAMRDFLVSSFDLKRFYLWLHGKSNWSDFIILWVSSTEEKDGSTAPIIETRMQEPTLFRVMAADSRSPRDGKHIEVLGYFNPLPGDLMKRICILWFDFWLLSSFVFTLFRLCTGQDGGKRMGLKFYRIKYVSLSSFHIWVCEWSWMI